MMRNARSSSQLPTVRSLDVLPYLADLLIHLATFELRIKNKAGKEGIYTVGAFVFFGVLLSRLILCNRHEKGRISKEGCSEA